MMRYAILTDIHANKAALDKVLKDLPRDAPEYFFLGDVIGYGPDPVECLKWLHDASESRILQWVPGNHDEMLYSDTISAVDGIGEDAQKSLEKHRDALENSTYGEWFLSQLGKKLKDHQGTMARLDLPSGRVAVFVHGALAPPDLRLTHYLRCWNKIEMVDEFRNLREAVGDETEAAVLFCGHSHFTFWAEFDLPNGCRLRSLRLGERMPLSKGLTIINPGSVGQPRDGDPRAAYAIFDPEAWTIEFRRVPYPIAMTTKKLESLKYPEELGPRLEDAWFNWTGDYESVYERPQWDLKTKGDAWVKPAGGKEDL
jgi:predicted phosphodiesterase